MGDRGAEHDLQILSEVLADQGDRLAGKALLWFDQPDERNCLSHCEEKRRETKELVSLISFGGILVEFIRKLSKSF